MTVENLNQIFRWTAVILPFVLAFVGVGALITGNIITSRKDAEIQLLKPRVVSDSQRQNLLRYLANIHGKIGFITHMLDGESEDCAKQLTSIFKAGGWEIAPTVKNSLNDLPGFVVMVTMDPDLIGLGDTVGNALNAAGIPCQPRHIEPNSIGASLEPDKLYIVVGRKK
jgi:hypothetical protein